MTVNALVCCPNNITRTFAAETESLRPLVDVMTSRIYITKRHRHATGCNTTPRHAMLLLLLLLLLILLQILLLIPLMMLLLLILLLLLLLMLLLLMLLMMMLLLLLSFFLC